MAASTVQTQSQELAKTLWNIANDLRGHMDASKFKNYILGIIFYRFLSERTEAYMDDLLRDDGVTCREVLTDPGLAGEVRKMSLDHLGYIIDPKNLYSTLLGKITDKTFSITDLEKAISDLTESTIGQPSEAAFDKLFDDMNLQDKDLGREVSERTALISSVMLKVGEISFNADTASMDVLGTAYMILIGLFSSDAGKKGGEFFTPTKVSELVARLATVGLDEADSVCDFCAGSGSLLLTVQQYLTKHKVGHFYGCEMNGSTYNLLRMNWLMHGLAYNQFTAANADSVATDLFYENGKPVPMKVQVANPPFSQKWDPKKSYLDDPRFSAWGALAPKSYEDFAFVQNIVYRMADGGRAAIILPHGVLFRGGAEKTIRKYLIDNLNYLDAVVDLPAKLFHGTPIPVCILVLRKGRNGDSDNILFIDASKYFTPGKNMNELAEEDINRIMDAYIRREDIDKFAHRASLQEIRDNDYNLNIPRYVDTFEEEEPVDLDAAFAAVKAAETDEHDADEKLKGFFAALGLEGVGMTPEAGFSLLRFHRKDGTEYPAWDTVSLSDISSYVTETATGFQNSYVGTENMKKNCAGVYFVDSENQVKGVAYKRGDSLVSNIRPYLKKAWYADRDGVFSNDVLCFRANDSVDTRYLYAFIARDAFFRFMMQAAKGLKMPRGDKEYTLAMPVYLPCMEEQKKIADFLCSVDAKIAAVQKKIEAWETIKKGLIQRLFV